MEVGRVEGGSLLVLVFLVVFRVLRLVFLFSYCSGSCFFLYILLFVLFTFCFGVTFCDVLFCRPFYLVDDVIHEEKEWAI